MIPWHPHSHPPPAHGATALIGIRTGNAVDPELCKRWMLVPGIHYWHAERSAWLSEQSGQPCNYPEYWYCLEEDLLAHLSARAHITENGHG